MSIARVPGVSTIFSAALIIPEVGTSVPFGMETIFPVTSLESAHPEISMGKPAFCATETLLTVLVPWSAEPAPEM